MISDEIQAEELSYLQKRVREFWCLTPIWVSHVKLLNSDRTKTTFFVRFRFLANFAPIYYVKKKSALKSHSKQIFD